MRTFRDTITEATGTDNISITTKQIKKFKFKFLRVKNNIFYFDVKGNSFLRGKTSKMPEQYWAGDWIELKDVQIIYADNKVDKAVPIID